MGEASASQLRIWSHGLPSLVTQTGWYATLPDTVVAFVRPECEADDIKRHLRALLQDRAAFLRMGEEGRRLLFQDHAPDKYSQAIIDFIKVANSNRPAIMAAQLAERAGVEMSYWNDLDEAYRSAARKICELL
jgi:hypothetical protein